MEYSEVEKILATSKKDDWIVNDGLGAFTYKKDLNLRIERADDDRDFNEPWAIKFPDKNARAINYRVFYNNSFVEEKMLVAVDGFRATLPLPKSSQDLSVNKSDVNFARIVDVGTQFDNYLNRAFGGDNVG